MQTPQFYDDIARYYELIFPDWEVSMSRQGAAIDRLIRRELNAVDHASTIHIVDASAGIGTQALPLASIDRIMAIMQKAGFVDVARDDAALYQPVLIGHRSR